MSPAALARSSSPHGPHANQSKKSSTRKTAFQSVYQTVPETPQLTALEVIGEIPSYVSGNLFRNGPGTFELTHADGDVTPIRHWFDGISMLHRFAIDGDAGTVSYMSKTTALSISRAAASVSRSSYVSGVTFGVMDPCKRLFGKAMGVFTPATCDPNRESSHNVGVTVEVVPGKGLMSRTDSPVGYRIDAEKLEVTEFESWGALDVVSGDGTLEKGGLRGEMSAAHGAFDEATGEYFNFTYAFGLGTVNYKVFSVNQSGAAHVLASIPYRPTYCHSIALTKKYVVLVLYPEFVNGVRVLFEKSLMGAMHFDASEETKFFVISREQNRLVATYCTPSFWAFHVVNAFDDDEGHVHVDLCAYKDGSVFNELYVENLKADNPSLTACSVIRRYTLPAVDEAVTAHEPPTLRTVQDKELSPSSVELVRINEKYSLRDYRYAFGPGPGFSNSKDGTQSDPPLSSLAKIDVKTGESICWKHPNHHCSEGIFVPNPYGVAEDDGALVSVCHDGSTAKSFLLILDASTMTEVARAYVPQLVPAGFHGGFV